MIIKFLLILFLTGLLYLIFFAFKIVSFFRKSIIQFKEQNNGQQRYKQQQHTKQVIIDRRSKEEKNKKIFKQNEGEYVDFQEEPPSKD